MYHDKEYSAAVETSMFVWSAVASPRPKAPQRDLRFYALVFSISYLPIWLLGNLMSLFYCYTQHVAEAIIDHSLQLAETCRSMYH